MKPHSYVGKKEKPMKKLSHGYHGKQYCSWVDDNDNSGGVVQHGITPANRFAEI